MDITRFDQYILDWWGTYLEDNIDNFELHRELFNELYPRSTPRFPNGDLDEIKELGEGGMRRIDYLMRFDDAKELYRRFIKADIPRKFGGMPSYDHLVSQMFEDAITRHSYGEYEFAVDFSTHMVRQAQSYDTPMEFFHNLMKCGCKSGMVEGFNYRDYCLDVYGRYANSMEDFLEYVEGELGKEMEPHPRRLPHYMWLCWWCYESLGAEIETYLEEIVDVAK